MVKTKAKIDETESSGRNLLLTVGSFLFDHEFDMGLLKAHPVVRV
jgi:hypothetical protein